MPPNCAKFTSLAPKSNTEENEVQEYFNPDKDFFVGSQTVAKLKEENFRQFISDKDASLVMFYNPRYRTCFNIKQDFEKAAAGNIPENRGYAAVNCKEDSGLCGREEINDVPVFRLYSRGHRVLTFRNLENFTSFEMARNLANCPVAFVTSDTKTCVPSEKKICDPNKSPKNPKKNPENLNKKLENPKKKP